MEDFGEFGFGEVFGVGTFGGEGYVIEGVTGDVIAFEGIGNDLFEVTHMAYHGVVSAASI